MRARPKIGGTGSEAGSPFAGAAGGAPPQPEPGTLGQPCIPGGLVDTGGGVAAAKISTFDHCVPGLSCTSASKCAAIPKCPQATGPCIEYDAGGVGGTGGTGGVGAGGQSSVAGAPTAGGSHVLDQNGVTAIAIDSTRLYWTEYGTRDSIGNYQNDGALKAMNLSDRTTVQLGATLAGPKVLTLTSGHAFVVTDGADLVGSPTHPKLLRISLADGTRQVIQDGDPPIIEYFPISFAASGDTLYWAGSPTYFSIAGDGTVPVAGASVATDLHVDDTNLYFAGAGTVIERTPLAGGAAESLTLDSRYFDLNGDSIYGLESTENGMILSKAAKSNGSWLRIRALGEGNPSGLKFVGERLFAQWVGPSNAPGVTTAVLGNTAPPVRLLDFTDRFIAWVATANKIYWTDGPRIYSRTIPTP